jgi:probable HAF family extracellular repeat protein
MTSFGTLPGDTTSLARKINDEGQVVGVSELLNNQNNSERAFLYSSGVGAVAATVRKSDQNCLYNGRTVYPNYERPE